MLASQVLYHLIQAFNPFYFSYFSSRFWSFCLGQAAILLPKASDIAEIKVNYHTQLIV
jgi:hypothetical protein